MSFMSHLSLQITHNTELLQNSQKDLINKNIFLCFTEKYDHVKNLVPLWHSTLPLLNCCYFHHDLL